MELNEIPDVLIDAMGGYKFILVKVFNSSGSKLVVRANKDKSFHKYILAELRDQIGTNQASCLGGGQICHYPTAKKIRIFGSSGDYGCEDRAETVRLLKIAYPDYEVVAESE